MSEEGDDRKKEETALRKSEGLRKWKNEHTTHSTIIPSDSVLQLLVSGVYVVHVSLSGE